MTKTYIFDAQTEVPDWVPLIESVWEDDLEAEEMTQLSCYRMWQGDYDNIPFFEE